MNKPSVIAVPAGERLQDSRFTVPGIRCAGCIAKIEREICTLPGVDTMRVNFSAKRVAVRHDDRLDDADLIEALRHLGFEAQSVDADPIAGVDEETKGLLRALAVAGFGMMNIMLLSVSVWSGAGGVTRDLFHWLSALIAIPVVAFSGRPFFASAAMALRYRRTNMDVPISIGVLLATGMSFYEALSGGRDTYFDGAVMLLFFLLAGRALDASMRNRTRAGIGALLSRMGRSASVLQADGSMHRIAASAIVPGMVMLVAAGEAFAADGEIIAGVSAIDNAILTGESAPVPAMIGDLVHAGAVNVGGPIQVCVTAAQDDTALAEIARLMDEAGQSRSRYVRIADRASRIYAPAVHTLAALAFLGWLAADAGWHQSLVVAISVLIITCPCAMGLAVPAAQVVASGALARHGVLIKDGAALERLAEIDVAVFDKTGTLTLGAPRANLAGLGEVERSVALALAQSSRHPLSRGLAASLLAAGTKPAQLSDVAEVAGRGLFGKFKGDEVALEKPEIAAKTFCSVLRIGGQRREIEFSDPLRSDAAVTLGALADMGIDSRILSGDRSLAVSTIANHLGVPAISAASPDEKLVQLETLKSGGKRPLMVGDGLNDGPALAAAHASLAPSNASDTSQQAADAVFLGDRLAPVALAVRVARCTMRVVRQNFAFAIAYNLLAVPIAIAGLVTPLVAAVAMSLSSLVVIANSLRLARATG
ncbi:heavy metal translocating P-type ATPase [Novosphingobium sp.]|uniref:heavy metal translocating P-type ATPase n=1 Tax=Novosphingobium sp. TaxID=1874826 RepID=UPI0025F743D4|nr:heavy metal translocating P-type ATPase [Novosphingobium sp.]